MSTEPGLQSNTVRRGFKEATLWPKVRRISLGKARNNYVDVTFLRDHIPIGDEKRVASEYAISFGDHAGFAPARQIH